LRRFHPVIFEGRVFCSQSFVVKKEEKLILDDGTSQSARELAERIIVANERIQADPHIEAVVLVEGI